MPKHPIALFISLPKPRLGPFCYEIRQRYFWAHCDEDLRWLINNHAQTRRSFDFAINFGFSFSNFADRLSCPNGCADKTRAELATRICPVCNCTGIATPAKIRKRVEAIRQDFFHPKPRFTPHVKNTDIIAPTN